MTVSAYFGVAILLFLILVLEIKAGHVEKMRMTTQTSFSGAYFYIILFCALVSVFWLPGGVYMIVSRVLGLLKGNNKEKV